jgi:hypothetical protein
MRSDGTDIIELTNELESVAGGMFGLDGAPRRFAPRAAVASAADVGINGCGRRRYEESR